MRSPTVDDLGPDALRYYYLIMQKKNSRTLQVFTEAGVKASYLDQATKYLQEHPKWKVGRTAEGLCELMLHVMRVQNKDDYTAERGQLWKEKKFGQSRKNWKTHRGKLTQCQHASKRMRKS